MTADTDTLGLRERKRLATRRAIQVAAVEIAAEHGVDRVTVDEISRIADISPRTFFNYFPTKEAALIGDGPQLPADAAVETFVQAGPESIFAAIATLLTHASAAASEDHELTALRRRVLKQHPHLFAMRMATMRQFEGELEALIVRRLIADNNAVAMDADALASRARLITLISFGVMRHAWTTWADSGASTGLADRLEESFRELEGLFE